MIARHVGIIQPVRGLLEAVKVVKDQRLPIHQHLLAGQAEPVLGEVPRREIGAGVLQDHNARETRRPIVQVLLVGKTRGLDAVVAPLQAALAPPLERGQAGLVALGFGVAPNVSPR